ncbi:GK21564 [uncultured Mediterranean phage uvMED]|nr:GK21564 [uncultured Mediterranean phage uvMED]
MTTVNVTTTKNTVTITENGSSTVVQNPVTTTVTATTAGPQGPAGSGFTLDQTAKVDKSIVYFDSASGQYKADDIITQTKLTDGGNF